MDIDKMIREAEWALNRAKSIHLDTKVDQLWHDKHKHGFSPASSTGSLELLQRRERELLVLRHGKDNSMVLMEGAL